VARRDGVHAESLGAHAALLTSRDWGLEHLEELSRQAADQTGVSAAACRRYFEGLDYGLGYEYLAGLTEFFGRLEAIGRVPRARLEFLAA
jgi:chorismate dehydratase